MSSQKNVHPKYPALLGNFELASLINICIPQMWTLLTTKCHDTKLDVLIQILNLCEREITTGRQGQGREQKK